MSLPPIKHIVLGLLIERPGYGYDLKHRLSERFAFLELSENAVYSVLNRLEEDGWIEPEPNQRPAQTRRGAPRIRYRPTPVGRQRFKEWISAPSPRAVVRDDLQGKLGIARREDLSALLAVTELQQRECLAELSQLPRPALADAADPDVPWSTATTILLNDFRSRWLQLLIDWLEAVRATIQQQIDQDAITRHVR